MTRRTRTITCILASLIVLAGCARTGSGSSGQGGIAALSSPTPTSGSGDSAASPNDNSGQDNGSGSGSGSGNGSGSGSGGHSSPSPSTNPSGPRIVSFTVTNVVCPDYPQGGGYQRPGAATLTWKIANADTVDVLMDGGLWMSYPGQQGQDILNFECTLDPPARKVSHTYTVVIKNTNVKKSVTATAMSNPSH